jgi:perosamine synthetase
MKINSLTTYYPRAKPYFSEDDRKNILLKIDEILTTGQISQGKYVSEFEQRFAEKIGVKYAVATNSCTSALEISMRSLRLKNKKIIVTTNTFLASVNSIILSGNIPLIVDIDEKTLCMSKKSILDNLDDDVGAIMWVHMAGLISPDFYEIKSICDEKDIFIIEDAAHAHGASIDNVMAGNLGEVGCFSFYPSKVLVTGEGGMITTDNKELVDRARILRYHGVVRNKGKLIGVDYGVKAINPSQNFRMTETSAIIGLAQLSHLDEFVKKRNEIAKLYAENLKDVDGITLIKKPDNVVHSYWNYYFILDSNIDRDKLANKLYLSGIENANAYDPNCHKQEIYKNYLQNKPYDVSDDIMKRHLSLPMYYELTERDINNITDMLIESITELK